VEASAKTGLYFSLYVPSRMIGTTTPLYASFNQDQGLNRLCGGPQ